jgi:hypothetical protein
MSFPTPANSNESRRLVNNQVQDETGAWIAMTQYMRIDPLSSTSKTFSWNPDGTINQIVMLNDDGSMMTLVFSYANGKISSIVPILT